MDAVYLLHHVRKDDKYAEDAKLIGVYRTEADARAAIERLKNQPGFRHFPDGFQYERYELNKDHWTEGFVTVVNHPDGSQTYEH
jgi:homoserine kinase type II